MTDNDGNEMDASELEDDFDEVEFEVGFNQGYTMSELDSELALELDNGIKEATSHSSGFVAGIREFLRSREVQKSREDELNELRNGKTNRNLNRDR
ncbi:MAG: hypothetical protein K9J17_05425 [Flavobacteriales bacterium]|nr:hypothetical protein [Flavobacteriales bacterium]